jgi:hypothetical protein
MRKCCVLMVLCCALLCVGCSEVPPLAAASGAEHTNILISDIVKRIKCEIADAFDDKLTDKNFLWLQNWTAKVDLNLQINETAGLAPSVSYTHFYRNAFNTAAGSTSLTSTVIAAVNQSFTLTAGANYSEQAQRAETLTFTLSLQEVKAWRQKKDHLVRVRFGEEVAAHFCDPLEREFRGYLGLKEWVDSALYPVTKSELQAGIHPQPSGVTAPPKATPPPGPKAGFLVPQVRLAEAKTMADTAAEDATKSANDAVASQASVAASLSSVQTAIQTNIGPYYAVMTDELKALVANNLATLTTILEYVKTDVDGAQAANAEAQAAAKRIDDVAARKDPPPPPTVDETDVLNAKRGASNAKKFADDATKKKTKASAIENNLTGFKPNPPIDGLLHSIQFIVTYGGSVTPNWSLLLWKGPGLTIPGASLSGVRTNILSIALGPTTEQNRLLLNQTIANSFHP